MFLRIEAEPNDTLHRLATKAVHLVALTHIPVKFRLNGIAVTVERGFTVRDVTSIWEGVNRQLTPTPVQ